jgi:8-hydroxy-5-deazaflavin:NADPH oxidoreductase
MRIGIIGAGHIGSTLARRFTELGHRVIIANSHGPASLDEIAAQTGATPVAVQDAVRGVDVVVLTIPMKSVAKLPPGLFANLAANVPLIDTCNYYPRQRDGRIAEIEDGVPESAWVERQIGHRVVKAFNNIMAQHLGDFGKEHGSPGRIALPVAGDDPATKAIVLTLVESLGFDALDAGPIADSWRQQPGTPAYSTDLGVAALRRALADAPRERTADWRATDKSPA